MIERRGRSDGGVTERAAPVGRARRRSVTRFGAIWLGLAAVAGACAGCADGQVGGHVAQQESEVVVGG